MGIGYLGSLGNYSIVVVNEFDLVIRNEIVEHSVVTRIDLYLEDCDGNKLDWAIAGIVGQEYRFVNLPNRGVDPNYFV